MVSVLIRETPASLLSISLTARKWLNMDSPASRTVENEYLSLKPPRLRDPGSFLQGTPELSPGGAGGGGEGAADQGF